MRLKRLVGQGFRNLEPFDLDLDAPFVVFHGANAQGKTNTLEAIWYLTSLKPLQGRRPSELVGWEADRLELGAWSEHDGTEQHRRVSLHSGKRKLQLDGGSCNSLEAYFAELRAIAFTPSDGAIITGAPEFRRRWIDRAAFTARPTHLEVVRAYARVLANKGATLREDRPDLALLDTLDTQLASLGARLVHRRQALLDELSEHVRTMVQHLAGRPVEVNLSIRTTAKGESEAERYQTLLDAFAVSRPSELRRRRSLVGPQMDDVVVRLGGKLARRYASRGQVRTLVLSLKLAELLAARERGVVPLFLLDDLSSELDRERTHRLIGVLGDLGAQVFASTTDPAHLTSGATDTREIRVEDGNLQTLV